SAPDSGKQWTQLFARRGLRLKVEATGCCGMSGTYGHEARNLATSRTIYAQSWAVHVDGPDDEGEALATGYSCRSQAKRMSARQLRHPLQALLDHVRAGQ
ncbi:FAD linked oxidase, partial [Burkholderia sp. TJI49]